MHNIEKGVGLAFVRLVIKTIGENNPLIVKRVSEQLFISVCLSTLVRVFKIVYN